MKNKHIQKMLAYMITIVLIGGFFTTIPKNVIGEEPPPEEPPIEPPNEQPEGLPIYDDFFVEGDGTYFQVTNSRYLNVTLTSSENIYISLRSVPKTVSFYIERRCSAYATLLTLSGFEANKTYYVYQEGDPLREYRTNENGSFCYIQDLTSNHHVDILENTSTVYLYSWGVSPATAPIVKDGDTYTLTANIYETIVIRASIILDGQGYIVQGPYGSYGNGIDIESNYVTIKNLSIDGFYFGIRMPYRTGITIIGTTISNNMEYATYCYNSNDITYIDNIISNNDFGLAHYWCSDITITGSVLSNNGFTGIFCQSTSDVRITGNRVSNNAITLTNYNGVISGVTITGNTISNGYEGIVCRGYSDGTITNNTISSAYYRGILLEESTDVIVADNAISNCTQQGIDIYRCSALTIIENIISTNSGKGIYLYDISDSVIALNTISNNQDGILLKYCSGIRILKNTIIGNSWRGILMTNSYDSNSSIINNTISMNNWQGITLQYVSYLTICLNTISTNTLEGLRFYWGCSYLTVTGNTISNNDEGIEIYSSTYYPHTYCHDNVFYHNNIIDNTVQVNMIGVSSDTWDNGAGEGNYWSDYTGVDDGSNGRTPGDGVGDTNIPHPSTYQLDNYPLMAPWIPPSNEPPVAEAGGPYQINEGDIAILDASSSTDINYDLLYYRWDFDNDATWDTDFSLNPYAAYSWGDDYTTTVKVEVTDGAYTATDTATVTIYNVPPVLSSPGAYTIDEGTLVNMASQGTDPGSDDLTFTWNWGDGTPDTVTTYYNDGIGPDPYPSPQYSPMVQWDHTHHTYGDEGVFTVTLTVEDDDGGVTTITTTITVNNVVPHVKILQGIGIAAGYILVTTYYAESYIINIEENGSLATPQLIDDKDMRCWGAGIGDFDNDGDFDALVGDRYNTWYYEKIGSGNSFAQAISIDSTTTYERDDFAEADFNNDGNLDAIMANYDENYYTLYMGNGNGAFTRSTMSAPSYSWGMDSGDFDGDGFMDFIVTASSGAYIYLGNGDGTFQPPNIIYLGSSAAVCAGDFDNDGDDDFIYGYSPPYLYLNNGDGIFSGPLDTGLPNSVYAMADADIDGDGNLDIVVTVSGSNMVYYYSGNGQGGFALASSTSVDWSLYGIAASTVLAGPFEVYEEELVSFIGEFSDPGWLDIHTATWDWGDGSPVESGIVTEENNEPYSTGNVTGEHAYYGLGYYTVTLTVSDNDGGVGIHTLTVNVVIGNEPPVADAGGPYIDQHEGEAYIFDASGSTDPNNDSLQYRWDFDNDGTWDTNYSTDPTATHTRYDDYTGIVTVEIYDGEYTATDTATVIWINRPPWIEPLSTYTTDEGLFVTVSGTSDDAGTDDLTFTWNWGDSTPDNSTIYYNQGTPTGYTNWVSHTYGDNGVYTVTLTVSDDDGGVTIATTTITVDNVIPQVAIPLGIGIADNYIVAANWYGMSWFIEINEENGSLSSPELLYDTYYAGCYGAGIGDFDNDYDLDVLIGDYYATWYIEKTGDGNSFAPAAPIDLTSRYYRMDFAEADFNNDGNLDAIMADYSQYYFTIYTGNGDGTFAISYLSGPNHIIGMDEGDFNGDGNKDFIAASWWDDAHIYIGNGDGTFQPPITLPIGWSWGVCAGDFDNDGDDDFVFCNVTTKFYPGNGDGTFGTPIDLGFWAYALAESDIDGDGNLDLVYTTSTDVIYRKGNGDGTFSLVSSTWVNWEVYSIATSPTAGNIVPIEVYEGELVPFNGTFSDLGWLDTHTATWNWGDGNPIESGIVTEENNEPKATGNVTGEHSYGDNENYTVTLIVTDDDAGSGSHNMTVIVHNVDPNITSLSGPPLDPIQIGTSVPVICTFTDPGWLDNHTASIDWNDGNTTIVDDTDGDNTITDSHTYTHAGVYTISVTITDDDGGSDSESFSYYIVVYDPSGGFVTGGGWIISPLGAYTPDPNLAGKANFGFVSKYKKGQSSPTGNTQFNFKVADLNFHSNDYQWLVIAGSKAMYKGNGTINGEGNYGFLLSAIDGDLPGGGGFDKFRIKIWNKDSNDEIIYDNNLGGDDEDDPATELGGGKIQIHKN